MASNCSLTYSSAPSSSTGRCAFSASSRAAPGFLARCARGPGRSPDRFEGRGPRRRAWLGPVGRVQCISALSPPISALRDANRSLTGRLGRLLLRHLIDCREGWDTFTSRFEEVTAACCRAGKAEGSASTKRVGERACGLHASRRRHGVRATGCGRRCPSPWFGSHVGRRS